MVVTPAGTLALAAGVYLASGGIAPVLERAGSASRWVILIVLMGITGGYFVPRQQRLADLAEAGAAEYSAGRPGGARAFAAAGLVCGDLLHGRQP